MVLRNTLAVLLGDTRKDSSHPCRSRGGSDVASLPETTPLSLPDAVLLCMEACGYLPAAAQSVPSLWGRQGRCGAPGDSGRSAREPREHAPLAATARHASSAASIEAAGHSGTWSRQRSWDWDWPGGRNKKRAACVFHPVPCEGHGCRL